ncbi:MAG: hypothetical protein II489_07570 [Bacteroidaceae bacterium]|nr:hypothetical protein [Bacteroidaceae bacterium]
MNDNNKYFYANRWYTFSYIFHEIFSIFFFVFMFNFIPLIMAFKHTIKPIWLTLLIPINILLFYRFCIVLLKFWALFIMRKPLAIVSEDSVSIFEGVRNGYACIKFKDIKGIKVYWSAKSIGLISLDVDDFDFYYNQISNKFVKFGIRLKQTTMLRNFYKRFYFVGFNDYIPAKNTFEFEDLVIKGANKYRNDIIDVG